MLTETVKSGKPEEMDQNYDPLEDSLEQMTSTLMKSTNPLRNWFLWKQTRELMMANLPVETIKTSRNAQKMATVKSLEGGTPDTCCNLLTKVIIQSLLQVCV